MTNNSQIEEHLARLRELSTKEQAAYLREQEDYHNLLLGLPSRQQREEAQRQEELDQAEDRQHRTRFRQLPLYWCTTYGILSVLCLFFGGGWPDPGTAAAISLVIAFLMILTKRHPAEARARAALENLL